MQQQNRLRKIENYVIDGDREGDSHSHTTLTSLGAKDETEWKQWHIDNGNGKMKEKLLVL